MMSQQRSKRKPKKSSTAEPQTSLRFEYSDDLESFSIHQSTMVRLYDVDSALEIPRDVADGYLILLSGGSNSAQAIRAQGKKNKVSTAPSPPNKGSVSSRSFGTLTPAEQSSMQLAFNALTGGNAIDALFGVKSMGGIRRSKLTTETAYNASNDAKQALMDAALASESIRLLAVETYIKCFEIIVKCHIDLERVTVITSWCGKQEKVRDFAAKQIIEAFRPLDEGVAAST